MHGRAMMTQKLKAVFDFEDARDMLMFYDDKSLHYLLAEDRESYRVPVIPLAQAPVDLSQQADSMAAHIRDDEETAARDPDAVCQASFCMKVRRWS